MKLNIGSGSVRGKYKGKDWVNIDSATLGGQTLEGVINIDGRNMPDDWTDRYDVIHAIHVLEHVNRNDIQLFLSEAYRVLKPGGTIYIEVPNFEKIIDVLNQAFKIGNTMVAHNMTTSIFGKQRYVGDQHCWGFTSKTLGMHIHKAGFKDIEVVTNEKVEKMISNHYLQEPVLLGKATK